MISNNFVATLGVKVSDAQLKAQINKLENKTINVKVKGGDGLKSIDNSITSMGKNFASTTLKVAKFGASTAIIGAFTASVSEAVVAVKNFDDVMIEFQKVSNMSGKSLEDYADKLGKLGKEVGRTKSEMVSGATEFVKAGFSESDSATLAEVSAMFQNVADSELSAGESASFIISQMKAFNITATDAMGIIDRVNEVDILAFLCSNTEVIKDNYIG